MQSERTALAWSRTSLALVVGALVGARLLADRFGAVAVLPMLVAALCGTGLMVHAYRRGRRRLPAAPDAARPPHGDGRLVVAASALTVALAGAGLVAVLTW
nr:DUF202 domain-containing protein [Pseudonocardia sp. C8]